MKRGTKQDTEKKKKRQNDGDVISKISLGKKERKKERKKESEENSINQHTDGRKRLRLVEVKKYFKDEWRVEGVSE